MPGALIDTWEERQLQVQTRERSVRVATLQVAEENIRLIHPG